jgi:hypothetical protein
VSRSQNAVRAEHALRCGPGSARSVNLPNVASNATPLTSSQVEWVRFCAEKSGRDSDKARLPCRPARWRPLTSGSGTAGDDRRSTASQVSSPAVPSQARCTRQRGPREADGRYARSTRQVYGGLPACYLPGRAIACRTRVRPGEAGATVPCEYPTGESGSACGAVWPACRPFEACTRLSVRWAGRQPAATYI